MSKSIKYPLTVIQTGRQSIIGVVPDRDDFDEHYVFLSGFTGIHKPELFAAAPELYEALYDLALFCAGRLPAEDLNGPEMAAAESAIAKARGEK